MLINFHLHNPMDGHEQQAKHILEAATQQRTGCSALAFHLDASPRASSAGLKPGAHTISQSRDGETLRVDLQGPDIGVVYAAYAWLRRQGWSFHAAGDIAPPADAPIVITPYTAARNPRFRWRGLQLWNYWWPGRDSWAFEDYAAYLDQLPKLGLNQFDFPLYWYEPLFTGVSALGAPMRRLPLSGVDVGLVRIGREALAGRGRFTSPDLPEDKDDHTRFLAARDLLRRVLDYAKARGIRTVIGVELANVSLIDPSLLGRLPPLDLYERGLLVQPSSSSGKALARARLEALFSAFPQADVYSIWQSEMGPWRSTEGSPHPDDVAFRQRWKHYAQELVPGDFDQLQWLLLATEIASELKPNAVLSTGGWGAERLMAAADNILPPGMIRATIADYEPGFGLRRKAFDVYERTAGPRHHTTWSEVDQHLWIQQPKIEVTSHVLNELESRGVDSVAMLHWRLLFNDPDLYSFAAGCWDDGVDPDEVRARWAQAKFGSNAGPSAAAAMQALEKFNAELVDRTPDILHSAWWVGFDCHMSGLLSANRYIDGVPISDRFFEENVDPLLASADAMLAHLRKAVVCFEQAKLESGSPAERQRLAFWANRAAYSEALYKAHVAIACAVTLAGRPSGPSDIETALTHIAAAKADDLVALFADRLGETDTPEKGELGLLLSLNVKFLGSVKRLEAGLRRILTPPASPHRRSGADVRAGALLPRREYATFFELLHVNEQPWTPAADLAHLQAGFGYTLVNGAVGRLSPIEGVWTHAEAVVLELTAPPGWSGRIDLYVYQELDWDAPFRLQDVYVNDALLGRVRDFHGRGEWCNEGLWLTAPVAFPPSGTLSVKVQRRGGGDARLSAFVLRP